MPSEPRVTFEPIEYPTDPRGWVLEPLEADEFPSQKNAHLVLTLPGCIRGNHFHREGTEVSVVIGPALVRYREADQVREHQLEPGEAVRFRFPPGVTHAMKNTGDTPQMILSFNTSVHDRNRPDVVRDVLID
ncbi:MAG: cupin domain-containing protein [Isosphaeraceae bacterium]